MNEQSLSSAEITSEAVVDRFEGETAVLVFQDGSVAYVPRRCLPEEVKVGKKLEIMVRSYTEKHL